MLLRHFGPLASDIVRSAKTLKASIEAARADGVVEQGEAVIIAAAACDAGEAICHAIGDLFGLLGKTLKDSIPPV